MTRPRPSMDATAEMGPSNGSGAGGNSMGSHGRPDFFEQSRGGWQQQQQQQQQQPQQPQHQPPQSFSPRSRMMASGIFDQQAAQGSHPDHPYEYPTQQEQQAAAGAAAMAHHQDQRGVSQLQGAASAAASGLGRPSMMVSPASGQQSLNQSMNNLAGVGSGMLQGTPADLRRGPVEFNHAISYVNKIKVCIPIPSSAPVSPSPFPCGWTKLTNYRTAFRMHPRSTSSSSRYYRRIRESRNRSRTSTLK